MSDKSTIQNTAAPSTQVREAQAITVNLDKLKPDLERVKNERITNSIGGALLSGILTGSLTYIYTQKSRRPLPITVATLVGVVLGGIIGKSMKTDEEERSETLLRAAKSGMFEEAIKHDMRKREEKAYGRGYSAGS